MKANHEFTKNIATEAEMLAFGGQLAHSVVPGTVIYLHGLLGAGKTTITRGFLRGLGVTGKVKSPTYTLVEPYEINGCSIFHFDLYRLNDPHELNHLGIHEYFTPTSICLVEWPEHGASVLPAADIDCYIDFNIHERLMRLIANTRKGKEILAKL